MGLRPRSSLKFEWDIVTRLPGICGVHYKSTTSTVAGRRGVLLVVGTALAMAKALLASSLLAGLIKPPLQHLRHWGPAEKGGGLKGHRMVRPGAWGRHTAARGRPSIKSERM